MSKKDLLFALMFASTQTSEAGIYDIIYDSIPDSIKESLLGHKSKNHIPPGITSEGWIPDVDQAHNRYMPNKGQGIFGERATHGLVHGSTITPGSLRIPEAPLERPPFPIAIRNALGQLSIDNRRGHQLTTSSHTKSNAAFNGRRKSNIRNFHSKQGTQYSRARNQQRSRKKQGSRKKKTQVDKI